MPVKYPLASVLERSDGAVCYGDGGSAFDRVPYFVPDAL
jgi:hypothetical protein